MFELLNQIELLDVNTKHQNRMNRLPSNQIAQVSGKTKSINFLYILVVLMLNVISIKDKQENINFILVYY